MAEALYIVEKKVSKEKKKTNYKTLTFGNAIINITREKIKKIKKQTSNETVFCGDRLIIFLSSSSFYFHFIFLYKIIFLIFNYF